MGVVSHRLDGAHQRPQRVNPIPRPYAYVCMYMYIFIGHALQGAVGRADGYHHGAH